MRDVACALLLLQTVQGLECSPPERDVVELDFEKALLAHSM